MIHSPGMLSVPEANFLYDTAVAVGTPCIWFELGVWCGRGLWASGCGLAEGSSINGIDRFTGELPTREGSSVITAYAPFGEMVWWLAGTVANSLMRVHDISAAVWKGDSWDARGRYDPDVVVVDAAHDYESVCRDLDAWLPKMKPNGLIIGHDYGGKFHGVTRAFDERFGDKCQKVDGTRFVKVQL